MADFYAPGAVEFYVSLRASPSQFYYLGTAVGSPVIEPHPLHQDLTCDRSGDGPWQKLGKGERHIVTVTLNRINYNALNRLRTGSPNPTTFSSPAGKLILNYKDFRLFYRFALPDARPTPRSGPSGAPIGRLYYSATLERVRESQPGRVHEVGLVIECNQLWHNTERKWKFYTDDPASPDWPASLPLE